MPDTRRMGATNNSWKQAAIQGGLGPVIVATVLVAYLESAFDPRPFPHTSLDDAAAQTELRLEVEGKIEASEQRIIERIKVGERRLEQSFLVQQQIWEAIRELPPDEFEEEVSDIEKRLRSLEVHTIKQYETYEVPE